MQKQASVKDRIRSRFANLVNGARRMHFVQGLPLMLAALLLVACSTSGGSTAQPSVAPGSTVQEVTASTATYATVTVQLISTSAASVTVTNQPTAAAVATGTTAPMATNTASATTTTEPTSLPAAVPAPLSNPAVGLQLVAQGLVAPVALVAPPDNSGRLFVVDQVGVIRVISAKGDLLPDAFLDMRDHMVRLVTSYDERGLLSLAFHPQFAQNGRFFVYYNVPLRNGAPVGWNHTDRVAEFKVSSQDPNKADPNSERIVLEVDHPNPTHNGGGITFGPDGYLYISLGDGGGPGDVRSTAQDTSMLLGKILRIDVNKGDPYGIPADNPFAGGPQRPEIYAYGFRNPYRISFDAGGDHSLYVEDAGENLWEEVDIVMKGGNYGWPLHEGAHCFDASHPAQPPATCASTGADGSPLIGPIVEYPNIKAPGGIGLVGVGGLIYRGNALPDLQGRYIFGDWGTSYTTPDGTLLVASPPQQRGQMWSLQKLAIATNANRRVNQFVRGFGEDAQHEIYVLASGIAGPRGNTGKVYMVGVEG